MPETDRVFSDAIKSITDANGKVNIVIFEYIIRQKDIIINEQNSNFEQSGRINSR